MLKPSIIHTMVPIILATAASLAEPEIAITDVAIVQPGSTDMARGQTVIVKGDKIVTIGKAEDTKAPEGATLIDGRGKYLIPGLWDMHVHMFDQKSLGQFTANGVTGVRVMFGAPTQLEWKKKTASGEIVGPRMVVGSPIVDGPKPIWPGSIGCADAEQGRAAVQKAKKAGYDFVKVYSLLPRDAYFAIADECKKAGIEFAGHVPYSVSIQEACKAGQRTSEHMMEVSISCSSKTKEMLDEINAVVAEGMTPTVTVLKKVMPEAVASFEKAKWDDLVKQLAKEQMWQCPTLIVLHQTAYMDDKEMLKDERMKYMPKFITMGWDPAKDFRFKERKAEDWDVVKKSYANTQMLVGLMDKAGVPILAGSDCGNPFTFFGSSLHEELSYLVKAGLTPTNALAAATTGPAKFFHKEKTMGQVKKGFLADMVLLSANPLDDIRNTTKIAEVIQGGKRYDRAALDAILKSCEY